MSVKVSPSILSGDFSKLGADTVRMVEAGADLIHCDVMDGLFVPNLTFGPKMVADIKKLVSVPLDVHLMIVEPERYLDKFIKAGADKLSFHIEATEKVRENLEFIKGAGSKAGLAICPETPISDLYSYLDICDFIIVMGVHPGFSGQKYIPETTERIKTLKKEIESRKLSVEIEMDGGANESNVKEIAGAGAEILVSGSCAFEAADPQKVLLTFKNSDK